MVIDWEKVRKVIINEKPSIYVIKRITGKLPYVKIHGFGYYGFNSYWYVMIEDSSFQSDPGMTITSVPFDRLGQAV